MSSDEKHILIAGAGIAGPALALLLTRIGHKCTIVERSPQWRTSGQQIDVSDEALKVIDFLGVSDAIWAKRVEDHGLKFVNEKDEVVAEFPLSKGGGIVKELEILRPDLANVFYETTNDSVEYIFDEHITGVDQHENGVTVTFASSNDTKDFDLVVAADGLRSKTRRIAFDDINTKIVELNQYASYFDIEWQEHDGR
jgi:2-polyprenyl-6-methoxyphenol hydroxylase-like FAD-dependent oxidoreductase